MNTKTFAFTLGFLLFFFGAFAQNDDFFVKSQAFFSRYVDTNGLVNYKEIKEHPGFMAELVRLTDEFKLSSADKNTQKAFFINAYNVMMIKSVVDAYPIAKPTDVAGIFDKKTHNVAGLNLTLSDIENKKLRPVYKDARLHFALVCGAISCPKLANFAFTPEKLESQLTARTRAAMDDPTFVRVDNNAGTVGLSQIFEWYKDDFAGQSFLEYVNKFRTNKIVADYKVSHYTYNWTLNVKK